MRSAPPPATGTTSPTSYSGANADKLAALIKHTPAKAQHLARAVVLGVCESVTCKESSRYPTAAHAAYLTQLAAWGYNVSDIEQILTGTTLEEPTDAEASGDKAKDDRG